MSPIENRRATGVVAAVAIVFGLAGGAAWGAAQDAKSPAEEETRSPNSPTAFVAARVDVDQAASSGEAINTTLAGLDQGLLKDVSVGASPTTYDRQGPWFYATIAPGEDAAVPVPIGLWEADLAQGAVADRLAAGEGNLANVLVGSSLQPTSADGRPLPVRGGAGDIQAGQAFAAQGQTDTAIVDSVTKVAAQYGLEDIRVRVLHALDPAVLLTAQAKDPQTIAGKFDAFRAAVLGNPARYEGVYIRIDTPSVSPLVIGSTAYRSGAGRLWIAPGYDELIGAAHGGASEMPEDR